MSSKDIATFVFESVPKRSRLDSATIEFAALERGLTVERTRKSTVLVGFPSGMLPFVGLHGPDSSSVARSICVRLTAQRALAVVNGLPVPRSLSFLPGQVGPAQRFAAEIGWPVAVRMADTSKSRRPVTAARNDDELRDAFVALRENADELVVEEQRAGDRYQLFVVDGVVISAAHRVLPSVVGDGVRSVEQLIAAKNESRAVHPYLRDAPIPQRREELDALGEDYDLARVLPDGEQLVLQSQPSDGMDVVDVTDRVRPEIAEVAVRSVEMIPGLPYAGVDITAAADGSPILDEVQYGLAPIGQFPTHGVPRDVAGAIIEHYMSNARWQAARSVQHQAVQHA